MKNEINHVRFFCINKDPLSGNPAAIIMDYLGDDAAKQALAKELNFPVTVFVEQNNQTFSFRFFYPACEMPLCVHGALSAAAIIMRNHNFNKLIALTNSTSLNFERMENDTCYLHLQPGTVEMFRDRFDPIKNMIGLDFNDIDPRFPFKISSVGSPKLLIPVKSYALLKNLKLNYSLIRDWSIENRINGLYVYYVDKFDKNSCEIIARGFNPKGGKNEDAATGVAAAALFQVTEVDEMKVYQGELMGHPSLIKIKRDTLSSNILVGGMSNMYENDSLKYD